MIDVGVKTVCFACDECGIHEQVERRMQVARELGENLQYDHCSCDKVGDEFWAGGYCEDAFAEKSSKRNEGRRKTGRAYRRKMRRKTIQKYRNGKGWIYGPHLRGHWEGGKFVLGSYIKHPQNSSNKAFFKRVSNKKVRRSSGVPVKGNGYRKIFDYWWTID